MDTKLKDQITAELLKTRFYSPSVNNKLDSEFADYKVYKLKNNDLCEQLFENPPPNDTNAHSGQANEFVLPPTPPPVNDESNFGQCVYCGKQRACLRRTNTCCVCGRCFASSEQLANHDEENIDSDTCCRCNDAAELGKPEKFMNHLNLCARKNELKYVYVL